MDRPPADSGGLDLRDGDTFRRFYDAALPVVYGYFVNRCGGRVDVAQELTQETFMTAIRSLQQDVPVTAPMPWIVAIARRRLVDHFRRQQRERARHESLFGGRPSPSDGFAATTRVDVNLQAALDRLAPHHRSALVLRYVDDLTVADVAGLLGCTERAAESLLARARAALRSEFEAAERDG